MELEEFVGLLKNDAPMGIHRILVLKPLIESSLREIYERLNNLGLAKDLNPDLARVIIHAYQLGRGTGFADGSLLAFNFGEELVRAYTNSR